MSNNNLSLFLVSVFLGFLVYAGNGVARHAHKENHKLIGQKQVIVNLSIYNSFIFSF